MSGATTNPRAKTYPFPETIPTDYISRVLRIPNDLKIIAAVSDVLAYLCQVEIWELNDGQEDYQAQALLAEMLNGYFEVFYMIGTIHPVALATIPDNMLLCDGATYNRVDYPALYDAIDAAYHVDADTFTVPLLTDRVPVGAGGAYAVNSVGGEATHTLTVGEIPSHNHELFMRRDSLIGSGFKPTAWGPTTPTDTSGDRTSTTAIGSIGGGQAHNNMQPYIALKYCIVAW